MLKWIPSSSHVEGRASIKAADSEFMSGAFVCFLCVGGGGRAGLRVFCHSRPQICASDEAGAFSFLSCQPHLSRTAVVEGFFFLQLTDGLLRRPIFSSF